MRNVAHRSWAEEPGHPPPAMALSEAVGGAAPVAEGGMIGGRWRLAGLGDFVRANAITLGLIGVVLGCFAISAFIVPTLVPVAIGDDWVYARSVEILVQQHHLKILDLSVATLVFQAVWGAIFSEIFGLSLGVMRLSTVVLVGLSGAACYGLCRELGVSKVRSALGALVYLFNPLAYVLAFTFMTDPHFTALLVISTFFYARGLKPDQMRPWSILAGSTVAGFGFLVRQHGALIPFAVVLYLLVARRLRPSRAGVVLFLQVVAIPAAMTIGYYLWITQFAGVPREQQTFLRTARLAGWNGTWQLVRWLTFLVTMYVGAFALPVMVAALFRLPRLVRSVPPLGWVIVCVWEGIVIFGAAWFSISGRWPASTRMPYIPQYVNPWQLGPPDFRAGRPWMFTNLHILDWVTIACAASSLVFILALASRVKMPATPDRAAAGLVLMVTGWQAVGILPPSYHFRTWSVAMDRYFLPLVPLAVCLALWALRDLWLPLPLAWIAAALIAVFSVAGTRDLLVFQNAAWNLARYANANGIPDTKLDAGAAWDGYHLWEYSNAHHIGPRTPAKTMSERPWWTNLFAPATDSSYVISTVPLPGYVVVARVEYSAWLVPTPTYLFLSRRDGVSPKHLSPPPRSL